MAMVRKCDICNSDMDSENKELTLQCASFMIRITINASVDNGHELVAVDVCSPCIAKLINNNPIPGTATRSTDGVSGSGSGIKFTPSHEIEELQGGWR